jgi:hypothetical protein
LQQYSFLQTYLHRFLQKLPHFRTFGQLFSWKRKQNVAIFSWKHAVLKIKSGNKHPGLVHCTKFRIRIRENAAIVSLLVLGVFLQIIYFSN